MKLQMFKKKKGKMPWPIADDLEVITNYRKIENTKKDKREKKIYQMCTETILRG